MVGILYLLCQLPVEIYSNHNQFLKGMPGNPKLYILGKNLASCPGWGERVRPGETGVLHVTQAPPRIPLEEKRFLGDLKVLLGSLISGVLIFFILFIIENVTPRSVPFSKPAKYGETPVKYKIYMLKGI